MSDLIPPFNFQDYVVMPWTEELAHFGWIILMGFFVAAACGLVGNYLILRRMALVGDAISHSILPGLAGAFLVAAAFQSNQSDERGLGFSIAMFIGALLAALLTTVIIEVIHKKTRVKQDAAIGIAFSSLFALGVVMINLFSADIHLDADCVLYGEITYIPLENHFMIGDKEIAPIPVVRMGIVAAITLCLIIAFYKELLVSSFDSGLAASLGINATAVHYGLMAWLSIVVVSAFEAVGAILVIAMLILPGATASLLTTRLSFIMILTVIHAALSTVLGVHLGLWLDCSTAGAMVVAGAFLFTLTWAAKQVQALLHRPDLREKDQTIGESPAV